MVEAATDILGDEGLVHHVRPVEQQVVVIEDILHLLRLDIGGKQLAQLVLPGGAPGKDVAQNLLERRLGVDGARIDRKAGALGRKAVLGLGEAEVVPDEVHQVGTVLAVVDGEGRIEADLFGIVAQQPRADAVEGAAPGERVGHDPGFGPEHLGADLFHAARHFRGSPARKGHEQDAARIGSANDQVGNAVGERVGLAGAGTGDDQQRAGDMAAVDIGAVLDSQPLLGVQFFQIGGGHALSSIAPERPLPCRVDFPKIIRPSLDCPNVR